MAGKESDVVLNFKTNGEVSYAKTVKDINKEMNLAATEYKNQVSAMDKDATQTEKLTATKKKLEKQVALAEQRTQLLREEYEKSVKETGEYSAESEKLYKKMLESETGQNKLKRALEETNEALEEQGKMSAETAEKLGKIEEAGEKVKGVGEKMSVGVTAPIMAAGAAGLAAFNEVDEALDTIITKTGATGDTADKLSQSFENVGSNTHLELQTVGEAIGEVNTQFGFMGKKLEESTDYLLKYAEINDTDVSQSAISARQAIEAYDMSYDDLNSVLDVTTKTSQNTGQSVDDLMQKAIDGAPQIKQLGLSFGEGVTLMGQFEQAGIDSGGALGYLSKASIVYAKDNKSLSQGLEETSKKIKNAKSNQEALTIASEVFGTRGASKMLDAIKRGTLSLDDLSEAAKNSAGTVGDTFGATVDPIDKSNQAMNDAKFAMASVGESIQVALLPVFEKAIDALTRFKTWFDSLDESQKQTILTVAAVVAAIGPFLVILGTLLSSVTKVATGIKTLKTVFTAMKLAFAANPFVLVIAGIALLIAGFVLAYNKCKWFRDGVNAFFQGIKDVGKSVFDFLKNHISGVFDGIMANFNNFASAGKRIFNGFIDFITGVFSGDWKKAWQGITDIFGGIFDGIVAMVKTPINNAIGLINTFLSNLGSIEIPSWVPKIGGKTFSLGKIPYLAKGGHLISGQAIVGEAGPELLNVGNGKTTVTPLTDAEKKNKSQASNISVEQHNHFGNVDANNPSELDRLNRKMEQASKQAIYDMGGVPT